MPKPTPKLTEAQVADICKMDKSGATQGEIAHAYGVSRATIRKALKPEVYFAEKTGKPRPKPIGVISAGNVSSRHEGWKARISDMINSDMGRLIHEGPSPQRRALMEEGRI